MKKYTIRELIEIVCTIDPLARKWLEDVNGDVLDEVYSTNNRNDYQPQTFLTEQSNGVVWVYPDSPQGCKYWEKLNEIYGKKWRGTVFIG